MAEKHPRYLRKKGSGRLYQWTPVLAKKDNLEEISYELAQKMIEASKKRHAEREAATFEPKPNEYPVILGEISERLAKVDELLAKLEKMEQKRLDEMAELERAENEGELPDNLVKKSKLETPEMVRQDRIDNDREVKMIREMISKKDVRNYLLEHYGEDNIHHRTGLAKLKQIAEDMRIERIFENEPEEEEE